MDPEHCNLCILIQEKQYEMNMMALRIMETNQPSQSEFKNLSETWSNLAQRLAWIHEVECPDLHVGEWLTRSIIVVVRPIVCCCFSCRLLWLSTFIVLFLCTIIQQSLLSFSDSNFKSVRKRSTGTVV
jgi:hypothetical protein